MATKESNPGVTSQILNLIAIVILLMVEVLFIAMFIKYMSSDPEDMIEGALAMCGLCMLVPAFTAYLAVCASITLAKRSVYGDEHASAIVFAFVLQMIGIALLLGGGLIFLMIFEGSIGAPLWVGVPFILIAWGWFLEMKDVGGKVPGLIGALVYSGGKTIFMVGSMIFFHYIEKADPSLDKTQNLLLLPLIGTIIGIIGLILLLVGAIQSLGWMRDHPPLIDTEQRVIMQGQQQQLMMQQELLELQRQQLIATKQLQNQITGGAPPPQIPHTPRRRAMKVCLSCGQQVNVRYKVCPFCTKPTSGPPPSRDSRKY